MGAVHVGSNAASASPDKRLMSKWSVHATHSDHAGRVRNNQRRHREKVKTHIAGLESKVLSLEGDLSKAHSRIQDLLREVEELRSGQQSHRQQQQASPPSQTAQQPTVSPGALRPVHAASHCTATPEERSLEGTCCRPRLLHDDGAMEDAVTSDREDLPAPGEGESTTSCETAYRILQQQSAGSLDPETAEQFLRPGYRRALRQGDGCRVQTQLVYGLLDHITS